MTAWLLEDWPKRFVNTYTHVGMAPSYLFGNISEVPGWLSNIADTALKVKQRHPLTKPGSCYVEVSKQAKTVLHNFLEHGAERLNIAEKRYPELSQLLKEGDLMLISTPLGEVVTLTKKGSKKLSKPLYKLPNPRTAASQLMRRRVQETLLAEGWTQLAKEGHNLISLFSPEGKKCYLYCGYVKYEMMAAQHSLKVLEARFTEENALFVVISREPEKLMGMQAVKEGWLEVIDANFVAGIGRKF